MNIVVSISGGRSSAMMARTLQTSEKYKDARKLYVFANTGMERPETIEFLQNIEKHWGIDLVKIEGVYSTVPGVGVRYKVVEYETMDMKAKVFSEAIEQYNKGTYSGLPSSAAPFCSRVMKSDPITKFAKDIFGKQKYIMSLGFRREDMPRRISWPEIHKDDSRIFPLLTDFPEPVGLRELGAWWDKQPFKLGISSRLGNCELCWKKSDKNLVEAIQHGTRFVGWWREHEEKYQNTAFRHKKSIDDFVRMAQMPQTMQMNFDDTGEECACTF